METLEPLSGDRKCFRLINGVLVERTVKDVVPALKTNQEGLKKVLDDMVKQYKSKQDELDKWKVISAFMSAFESWVLMHLCRRSTTFRLFANSSLGQISENFQLAEHCFAIQLFTNPRFFSPM